MRRQGAWRGAVSMAPVPVLLAALGLIRAVGWGLVTGLDWDRILGLGLDPVLGLDLDRALGLGLDRALGLGLDRVQAQALDRALAQVPITGRVPITQALARRAARLALLHLPIVRLSRLSLTTIPAVFPYLPGRKTFPVRVRGTAGPSTPLRSGRDDNGRAAVPYLALLAVTCPFGSHLRFWKSPTLLEATYAFGSQLV
jgi:hypothetical protein